MLWPQWVLMGVGLPWARAQICACTSYCLQITISFHTIVAHYGSNCCTYLFARTNQTQHSTICTLHSFTNDDTLCMMVLATSFMLQLSHSWVISSVWPIFTVEVLTSSCPMLKHTYFTVSHIFNGSWNFAHMPLTEIAELVQQVHQACWRCIGVKMQPLAG